MTGQPQLPFSLADPSLLADLDSFVDGHSVPARSGRRFDVVDPGSGKTWASCADCRAEDVDHAVLSSQAAFRLYSAWTGRKRAQCLAAWHTLIQASREDLATILVHETGKPLSEARAEVDYGASFVWWFAGEADRIQGSTLTSSVPGLRGITIRQPVGVVAALVPWNFPLALVLRKSAIALAAGCTVVLKPSPETPLSAVALARLALRAGFPPGALNVLTTSLDGTPALAEALCLHPRVAKVTFTGSTRVGKLIAGLCAVNLKKSTMELGGNCPFIVFDDALTNSCDHDDDNADDSLRRVVGQLVAIKWRHAGQACVGPNRLYVQRAVHDRLVAELVRQTAQLQVGHGMADGTTFGPVTTPKSLDRIEAMMQDALAKGATPVLGSGKRRDCPGYFIHPTVLTNVTDDMLMSREEIFGPLLGVSVFDSEDEVVQRANNTAMGLTAYVFTKNVDRLWRLFERLEAGMIGMNCVNTSSAEVPFGGIKDSGYGKESGKDIAIQEFLITKGGTLAVEGL